MDRSFCSGAFILFLKTVISHIDNCFCLYQIGYQCLEISLQYSLPSGQILSWKFD